MTVIDDAYNYLQEIKTIAGYIPICDIKQLAFLLSYAYEEDKSVFIMGNGGSAMTASHFACDINKGVGYARDKKLRVYCLNDNIATVMAYANDVNYTEIFTQQLHGFAKEGDIVIGISGSGNSENVLSAMRYANSIKCYTFGMSGFKGGELRKICRDNIVIPVDDMQITEDFHLIITHILMKFLNNHLSKEKQ